MPIPQVGMLVPMIKGRHGAQGCRSTPQALLAAALVGGDGGEFLGESADTGDVSRQMVGLGNRGREGGVIHRMTLIGCYDLSHSKT